MSSSDPTPNEVQAAMIADLEAKLSLATEREFYLSAENARLRAQGGHAMSTTPTEAHLRLVREMALQGQYLNRSIEHYAQEIADSEARAVEATIKRIEQEELEPALAALTAERVRVRVLREAVEIMLVPHIENSEGGTPSGTYAMTFRYEQLAAALAFTAEHAKEGSK